MRALVAIMIMVLMATSSAFARKASQHHSKRAAPSHQLATKPNPAGVERHPDDVVLDRERSGAFAVDVRRSRQEAPFVRIHLDDER